MPESTSLPRLRPREVVRALERAGLQVKRQTGSHVIRMADAEVAITENYASLLAACVLRFTSSFSIDQAKSSRIGPWMAAMVG